MAENQANVLMITAYKYINWRTDTGNRDKNPDSGLPVFYCAMEMQAVVEADLADSQITMGEETRIQSEKFFKKQ